MRGVRGKPIDIYGLRKFGLFDLVRSSEVEPHEGSGFFMFPDEVADKLGFYVYRLIDPRNGETFYIGKGQRNRVFAHVGDELGADGDTLTEKLQRIRDIRKDGFEVAHVIHRR